MLKKVMIKIATERAAVEGSLFDAIDRLAKVAEDNGMLESGNIDGIEDLELPDEPVSERLEMVVEGKLKRSLGITEIKYAETELSGMEGSQTTVIFNDETPELVTLLRTGAVETALVFEEGERHICVYNTPYMPFEVCINALSVDNRLIEDGEIIIEYLIELHGAAAEKCRLEISVKEVKKPPVLSEMEV